jgi:predicted RNA-binding Zn ribbon-like protein
VQWNEVDGYPMPPLLAGHPGLELCNTWAGWDSPPSPHRDWLRDFDRLAVWTGHTGLLPAADLGPLRAHAAADPAAAARVLDDVRALRTALHDVLLDPADGESFAHVARQARRATAAAVLTRDDGAARWVLPTDVGLELPLLACARAAADLLTDPACGTVRSCPGDECGWLFLDARGRRRWCSMAVCGNRAKVRAYAHRRSPR